MNLAVLFTVILICISGKAGAQNIETPDPSKIPMTPRSLTDRHMKQLRQDHLAPTAGASERKTAAPVATPVEAPAAIPATTTGLWSCNCSNLRGKICFEHEKVSSLAVAIQFAKRRCGENCTPECRRHSDAKTPVKK